MTSALRPGARLLGIVLTAVLLCSCATVRSGREGAGQRLDPWENWNRKVFAFNESLDEKVLKPVATAYAQAVPQPVRVRVGNFYSNVLDAWSAVNNMLQGKFTAGFEDIVRVGTNTVFGLFGVLDVASEMGLEHHYEDFGQTLGHWGVGPGAYMVLPLLGPSTVRDTFALPLDRSATPALFLHGGATPAAVTGLQIVNTRANLLGASRVIDDISLDKYTFLRDAYLQRRRNLIFDGDAPEVRDESRDRAAPAGGRAGAEPAAYASPADPAASAAPVPAK